MFVRKLMEIGGRFPKAQGRRWNTLDFIFFFGYLLDTHAEHMFMFFSALLQDSSIGNMLVWEGKAAERGFKNPFSHGYFSWWCTY